MDADTPPSVESDNPIDDLDLSFGDKDVLIGTLLPLTVVYREYILDELQTNVVFNSQHLQIALLSDVECMENFHFQKEVLNQHHSTMYCHPKHTRQCACSATAHQQGHCDQCAI
jgi:hypothetical protein